MYTYTEVLIEFEFEGQYRQEKVELDRSAIEQLKKSGESWAETICVTALKQRILPKTAVLSANNFRLIKHTILEEK